MKCMITKSSLEYKDVSTSMDDALESDKGVFLAIKNYRLQSLGRSGIELIVDRLNLEPFLEFLHSFNASNTLPYHNYYHATCVFLNCYEGAWLTKLEDEETRGLCAGALFHDFNHSGGKLDDAENIKRALDGLMNAQIYAESNLLGLSPTSLAIAKSAIAITKDPFEGGAKTFPEQIIMDADLMQPYEESSAILLKQYLGLKAEYEVWQRQVPRTPRDFPTHLKQLLNDEVTWHTEWAIEKAQVRNWEIVKSDLLRLMRRNEGHHQAKTDGRRSSINQQLR